MESDRDESRQDDNAAARELVERIVALLRAGQKIEAIKIYREATGRGLKEAKDAVEAIERRDVAFSPGQAAEQLGVSEEFAQRLETAFRDQGKIPAIKLYRETTGAGLKEAKEAVERFAALRGLPASQAGCAGSVLLTVLILLACITAWAFAR